MNFNASVIKSRTQIFDIECARTTHRRNVAKKIMTDLVGDPIVTHGNKTFYDWAVAGSLSAEKHLCGTTHGCTITWPEWVTDEMFDLAWQLAEQVVTAKGQHNRSSMRPR